MSCMYYRVVTTPAPAEVYGFKKVSAKQLDEITERVTKPTYNRTLATGEQTRVYNYMHSGKSSQRKRAVNFRCSKSAPSSDDKCNTRSRKYTDKEIHRLIRRLRRPTFSFEAQKVNKNNDSNEETEKQKLVSKQEATEKEKRRFLRLQRPTTASLAKTLDVCHLCYDHERKRKSDPPDAFDYSYDDEKVVPVEEVDFIIERLRTPTLASKKGSAKCRKTPPMIDEVKIREDLPLLSGLSRSKSVHEITSRLHCRSRLGMTPCATAIEAY